jgi:hypothetical protein
MTPPAGIACLSALLAAMSLSAPRPELRIGKPQTVAESATVARPAAAFGRGVYLVLWRSGWPGLGGTADILASRLERSTLRRLDRKPIAVCTAGEAQDAPRVAHHRGTFLVVWQDFRNGRDFDVLGALVDAATGHVLRKDIVIVGGKGNQVRPAVAETDERFLVVWQDWRGEGQYGISSRRVSSKGQLLETGPQNIADVGARPAIARSGGNLLISWVTGSSRGVTSACLLRSRDAAKVKELKTIIPCCQYEPAAAGDGRGSFMAVSTRAPYPDPWGWGGPGAVVCARVASDGGLPEGKLKYGYRCTFLSERRVPNVVDAASWGNKPNSKWKAGAPGGFPGTHDGLWPRGWPAVAHGGDGLYLLAWVKGRISQDRLTLSRYDVWLRGMDGGSLEARLPDRKVAGRQDADETRPVLVSGPASEVVLLHEEIATEGPRRIVARRLSVELPAPERARGEK